MKNKSARPEVPTYKTIKEIVVVGTQKGGDKKQYMFLDKNKNECTRTFNDTIARFKRYAIST